jgi:hypothetical protein
MPSLVGAKTTLWRLSVVIILKLMNAVSMKNDAQERDVFPTLCTHS